MKYRITVGAFVTHIANGTITVAANSEDEAIEKAKDRFIRRQLSSTRNNDVGDVQVDSVEEVD